MTLLPVSRPGGGGGGSGGGVPRLGTSAVTSSGWRSGISGSAGTSSFWPCSPTGTPCVDPDRTVWVRLSAVSLSTVDRDRSGGGGGLEAVRSPLGVRWEARGPVGE